MTVSGVTDATTLKNCIDFRKLTFFFNFLKFDKNYLRHITSTSTIFSSRSMYTLSYQNRSLIVDLYGSNTACIVTHIFSSEHRNRL